MNYKKYVGNAKMRSAAPMRAAKTGYIILSILYCALGIFFMVMPDFSISVIGLTVGIGMIVFEIVKIFGYFSEDLFRLAFQYDLAFGKLLIVLGIIVLVNPKNLLSFFCIVVGIAVLCDGLFKIQIAIDSKQFGIKSWWLILILAVLAVVADGILNLVVALFTVKIIDHQLPDEDDMYIEVNDY